MDRNDAIGKRGEAIFTTRIMSFCENTSPYFNPIFLGEKADSLDFMVEVLGVPASIPLFFVQVKATRLGYTGRGKGARLRVKVASDQIREMLRYPVPCYLVGIDEPNERSFLVSIQDGMTRGFSSMSTSSPLDCSVLKRLWEEMRDHWQGRRVRVPLSSFRN